MAGKRIERRPCITCGNQTERPYGHLIWRCIFCHIRLVRRIEREARLPDPDGRVRLPPRIGEGGHVLRKPLTDPDAGIFE